MQLLIISFLYSSSVDVLNAGEGEMEISISTLGNERHNIPHQTISVPCTSSEGGQGGLPNRRYEVLYTTQTSGKHEANVLFNNQHVVGLSYLSLATC